MARPLRPGRTGFWLGTVLAAALAYWVITRLGWDAFVQPWRDTPWYWLLVVLATQLASYLCRAARLVQMESTLRWSQTAQCLRLLLIHNAWNLLLPMRSGEASFPWLMHRWFGVDPVHATGQLLWLRLYDLHVLAVVSLAAACTLEGVGGAWVGAAFAMIAVAAAAPLVLQLTHAPIQRRLSGSDNRTVQALLRLSRGVPNDPATAARCLAWTWLGWLVKLAGLGALLATLMDAGWAQGLLGAIGGDLSTILPFHAPAGLGSFEAGVAALTLPFGIAPQRALSAALNLHLVLLGIALAAAAMAALPWPPSIRRLSSSQTKM